MNISWLLCAIFLALALYVCYIKIYASQIENMSDLDLILSEIQHQRKRKTTTNSMNEVKDEQYNTRIRTSQNVGLLKEYTHQFNILS